MTRITKQTSIKPWIFFFLTHTHILNTLSPGPDGSAPRSLEVTGTRGVTVSSLACTPGSPLHFKLFPSSLQVAHLHRFQQRPCSHAQQCSSLESAQSPQPGTSTFSGIYHRAQGRVTLHRQAAKMTGFTWRFETSQHSLSQDAVLLTGQLPWTPGHGDTSETPRSG